MDLHLAARTAGRAVVCAGALAAGAALGHFTDAGRAPSATARAQAPLTAASVVAARASEPSLVRAARPVALEAPSRATAPPKPVADATGHRFRQGRVITGETTHRLLLFTFDDGPDPRTTPTLLDHLDRAGVKAIFFVTTGRFEEGTQRHREIAELAREIVRRGHVIGHHTVSHPQLPLLDDASIEREVREGQRMIEEAIGFRPWLFRPPGGARSPRVDRKLSAHGYTSVLWNLGAGDFQVRTADEVVHTFGRVLDRNEREGVLGGIVLLHDTHPWSVEAFPRMIAEIRERNCQLLDRGEELYDIVDDLAFFHAPLEGDDPSAVAPPATPSREVLAERQLRLREEYAARCAAYASR